MDNWYFFYDSGNFDKNKLKTLSKDLEKRGFGYRRCIGLGGCQGSEQIFLWLRDHQYITGVMTGVLANYVYDILKMLHIWFKNNKPKKQIIPIVQFFISFKDVKSKRLRADLSFRFDRLIDKEEVEKLINAQAEYLNISSQKEEKKCSKCREIIYPGQVYYINTERVALMEPICIFCRDKLVKKIKK
jgi:hypothetical protein